VHDKGDTVGAQVIFIAQKNIELNFKEVV